MKRFQFSLEKVRDWRKLQQETERARLEMLIADRFRLEQNMSYVDRERREAEQAALLSADALQLGALDDFRHYLARKKLKLAAERLQISDRIDQQRRRLVEAQRNTKVLDTLKGKALEQWQRQFDKELEEQAAETALYRWRRRAA
ncbi:MAG: hypothetical protein ACRD44_07415 [Bryobacteraceae bacterium]